MAFVASALLDPVCERVMNAALEEYKLVKNVEKELQKLRSTASLTRGVLHDAEEKQVQDEAVRTWLRELKGILYDAEDILEEATIDPTLRKDIINGTRSSVSSMKAKVRNALCCISGTEKILSRHALAHEIKAIRLKLDEIYRKKVGLGLQVLPGHGSSVHGRNRRLDTSSMLADESCITGRDEERKEMVQKLLGSTDHGDAPTSNIKGNNVHVLALVGMGGVGKTTLAKVVFNDVTVKQHFDPLIWVCVSEDFDLVRVTSEIMDAVSSSREQKEFLDISNWDSAQKRLKDKIEGKRFLLVLDDVWEEDPSKWESLSEPLKCGGKGSKVIVTTRKQKVSKMMKAIPISLKALSSQDLWPIFKGHAFDGCGSNKHIQLETIGRKIVERLKGSPLAAKTIGRLLNQSLDVRYWKKILESDIFKLEQHSDDIQPVLKLSYNHLPGHLKQCFAYCSLFPKDFQFSKAELAQHWMAQHFTKASRGFQAEAVLGKYFDDLLHTSFFDKYRQSYVMHDLIHDLAESISEDDYFRLGEDQSQEFRDTIRHVSIATGKFDPTRLKELCRHGNLRTLLLLHPCRFELQPHLENLLTKLKRLRVLGLKGCNISELPASISTLRHLRFVDLSYSHIDKLPESFCSLYELQVLKLKGCWRLGALPRNMNALVNLMHLEARDELVSTIRGLGKLTALQELTIGGTTSKVRELGEMSMLRVLRILNLEQVASEEEAARARLHVKENLDTLHLSWKDDGGGADVPPAGDRQTSAEGVLEGLRPADSIRELVVRSYGGVRSPRWLGDQAWLSSSFLEMVELYSCENWEVLPPLGQLRCLKSLKVSRMSRLRRIGPEFMGCRADGAGGWVEVPGFPSLEDLYISSMPGWEEWEVPHRDIVNGEENDHEEQQIVVFLPRLRRLRIDDCPGLKELPPLPRTLESLELNSVGLTHLPRLLGCSGGAGDADYSAWSTSSSPSLSKLLIGSCPNLRSLSEGWLQHPLPKLALLVIGGCAEMTSLPGGGLAHLTSLRSLRIGNCPKLCIQPPMNGDDATPCSLEEVALCDLTDGMMEHLLLAGMRRLTSLHRLHISVGSQELLGNILQHLPVSTTLRTLAISRTRRDLLQACSSSSDPSLPPVPPLGEAGPSSIRDHLTSLTSLEIHDWSDLLLQVDGLPSSLETLTIGADGHLEDRTLSAYLQRLSSLRSLVIYSCPLLTSLPTAEVLRHLTALERLTILGCKQLTSLGDTVHSLVSLQDLRIDECPKLLHLAEAANSPSSSQSSPPAVLTRMGMRLRSLRMRGSSPQQITTWLRQCSSLQSLEIESCPQLTCFDDDDGGGNDGVGRELEVALLNLAPSLRKLELQNCGNLRSLPSKLRCLSSLERLNIWRCPQVQCMPSAGLPDSLEKLRIEGCPGLEERCSEEGRRKAPLMSHTHSSRRLTK